MLVAVESAKSITYYAAWAADQTRPTRRSPPAMAKAYTSDAYRQAAGDGIQIHGGIGFTWEHDLHLYFKRAKGYRRSRSATRRSTGSAWRGCWTSSPRCSPAPMVASGE